MTDPKNANDTISILGSGRTPVDIAERRRFTRAMLAEKGRLSYEEIRHAMREKYGRSLSTSEIAEILRDMGMNQHTRKTKKPKLRPVGNGRTRSQEDIEIRTNRVREIVKRQPYIPQKKILELLKQEFGLGIDTRVIGRVQREARNKTAAAPPSKETLKLANEDAAKAAIKAAVGMLLEECPYLASLTVKVNDDGKPEIEYTVRTVTGGKVEL